MLESGLTVGDWHFNERNAHEFMNILNTAINLELKSIKWIDKHEAVRDVSIDEGKRMAGAILAELARIHLNTTETK